MITASSTRTVKFSVIYPLWVNRVERLWQALHDTITGNDQCRSMWPLLKKVRHFMETASSFPGGKHGLAKV
ncbi:transposase [Erwinia tracheiphila]|uniref:Transposase n=1 Tax=Erwinia tracheiphila TaxID=65700 RepID=A0A0M2K832_9GAMM|nr:transposase [Erwinia tracheiphila]